MRISPITFLRALAATLLLGASLAAPAAWASGGKTLTKQFPLGSQTITTVTASTSTRATTRSTRSTTASGARRTTAASSSGATGKKHGGGIPSVVYIAGPPLIAIALILGQLAFAGRWRRGATAESSDDAPETAPAAPETAFGEREREAAPVVAQAPAEEREPAPVVAEAPAEEREVAPVVAEAPADEREPAPVVAAVDDPVPASQGASNGRRGRSRVFYSDRRAGMRSWEESRHDPEGLV